MKNNLIRRKGMVFSIEEIKERLPHRYPFLMIDRIIEQEPGKCTSIKNVSYNEPFFVGHFSGQSVMPGNLISEAMAQTAAFVGLPDDTNESEEDRGKKFLTSINIKILQPVIPGDQLCIKVKFLKRFAKLTKFMAKAFVDGNVVASGNFSITDIE
jgi:3-hydroxyacyl-[acyl-carrier-protein] dehydratase